MKKELQLLKALTDIDERYLLEIENYSESHTSKRIKKPVKWLLVAIIALGISATAYAAIQWSPVFMDWFKPSDAIIEQTAEGVQNVDVVARCDDVTLHIDQTIGDEDTLYVNLEISLPDEITWRDVLPEDLCEGQYEISLTPKYKFYRGKINYEDIKGLSEQELRQKVGRYGFTGHGGLHAESLSLDSNTASFLINYSADNLTSESVSLILTHFVTSDMEAIVLKDSPYVISWTPENSGKQYTFVIEDGEIYGKLELSSFRFKAGFLNYPKIGEYEDGIVGFSQDIIVHFKNGTERSMYSLCGGGGGSTGKETVQYQGRFRQIMNLNEVEAIQINDYWFELEE